MKHTNQTDTDCYWFNFGKKRRAKRDYACSKCGFLILKGTTYRGNIDSGSPIENRYYHTPNCTGFIASRYHKVNLENFSQDELEAKKYYDLEALKWAGIITEEEMLEKREIGAEKGENDQKGLIIPPQGG